MDPQSKKLLEDTFALVEENNKLLQGMRRSLRNQRILSIIYWVFIIGSAVGAYYFIQPYVDQLIALYRNAGDVFKNLKP